MAEKKKLSVAEILAAARKTDGGDAPQKAAASEPADEAATEAAQPAAETKPAAKKPGGARLSVAAMMAAARAEKQSASGAAESKPAPAAKAGSAAKPTAKPAAAKASPKPAPAAAKASAPKDTGSILAEARSAAKPGPMSKAEAARRAPSSKESPKAQKPRITVPPMPAKPDYAQPKSPKTETDVDRRGFLTGVLLGSLFGIGWVATSVTFGLWTLGTARFMFPNVLTEPPSQFKIGSPGDYAPEAVSTKWKAQFGVWIVNTTYDGQQEIYALRTVCTHLGCTPNWLDGERKFKCPCHGSGFYLSGINFEGPAPRPLERYAIRLAEDGQLEVDKSRLFQQELGQWEDPASYVVV